ncbi:MAG: hypothetical protein MHMPM18_000079 [Marteilia pararefringens]
MLRSCPKTIMPRFLAPPPHHYSRSLKFWANHHHHHLHTASAASKQSTNECHDSQDFDPQHLEDLNRQESPADQQQQQSPDYHDVNGADFRFNQMRIQMLPESVRRKVFGYNTFPVEAGYQDMKDINNHFDRCNIKIEKKTPVEFTLNRNRVPRISGRNLTEHFKNLGQVYYGKYLDLINKVVCSNAPSMPNIWSSTPGWTKYYKDYSESIAYPDDRALIFDMECMVKHNYLPVMAIALSDNHWYSWCSGALFESKRRRKSNLHVNDLIFIESSNSNPNDNCFDQKKIIIGHNIMFDRSFIGDQYLLKPTSARFLDTLSMSLCLLSNFKDETGKAIYPKGLKSLKLADLYYFATGSTLSKAQRDVFVDGSLRDVTDSFQSCMSYCASDVLATQVVLKEIWNPFRRQNPSSITLGGILEMSQAFLPINTANWDKYIKSADENTDKVESAIKEKLMNLAKKTVPQVNKAVKSPIVLNTLDWEYPKLELKPNAKPNLDPNITLRELEELSDRNFKPCNAGRLGFPNWYAKLCSQNKLAKKLGAFQTMPNRITPSMINTFKLLGLQYGKTNLSFDLVYDEVHKWGFVVPGRVYSSGNHVQYNSLPYCTLKRASIIKVAKNSLFDHIVPEDPIELPKVGPLYSVYNNYGYWYYKLPQPMSLMKNCGNPLVPEFRDYFPNQPLAQEIITFNEKYNYWCKNRQRIKDQMVVNLADDSFRSDETGQKKPTFGGIIPRFWVIGTITRRAIERTWLTSSNVKPERCGSELRSMIQSPPGYSFVGADVDSQEYWIASIISDNYFKRVHGCTAFSYMILNGDKSDKSDLHSKVARDAGIDRETAKIFNYARLYGASSFFAANLLKSHSTLNNKADDQHLFNKALKMTQTTKGIKNELGEYVGGTESHFFNAAERNALSTRTKTPFLNSYLNPFALRCRDFSRSNMRSLVNWTVQSSAVDYLHTLLCTLRWLASYYNIKSMQLVMTFHDELRLMVDDREISNAILALQTANLFTRAYFSHKLGMDDLPISVAFFSAVEVDKCIRKDPNQDCVTPSNPDGIEKTYGIPVGRSHMPDYLKRF